mgnify:FL=1
MRVFAISDLHLSSATDKPMDIFGSNWIGHWDKIRSGWLEQITDDDVVLSAGDTSWGMNIPQALADLQEVDALPGTKFIIRGNHDYWWSSYAKINALGLGSIKFIQNNAIASGDYVFCGTRGWTVPEEGDTESDDKKIFDRELIRLKLTLDAATAISDDKKIVLMTHYPPFNSRFDDSPFTDLIKNYRVDKVVYGHLHGNVSRANAVVNKNGIEYVLTSCDFLNFKPILLYDD